MKEKIFKNFSLKILSIICAIILWGVIVNIYDPNTGVTISNVAVQLINAESLTDNGYSYEVVDGSKIAVYVSGPKSIITDIKASDIVATADLSQITAFADYVDIDVKVEKDGKILQNVEVTPKTTAVKLNIENRITQAFDVKVEMTGTGANGFVILNDSVSPSTIKITGPSSKLTKIAQVKAVYDITDASSDISDTAPIVLYDYDGNVIDDDLLELSRTEVRFTANVGYSKTVDVVYQTSGTPADGKSVKEIETGVTTATISGEVNAVDAVSQIKIPAEVLNVEGATENKEFKIWLSDYVPSGITIASTNYVNVKVILDKVINKDIKISAEDIKITNMPSGMQAVISPSEIKVSVKGNSEMINSITAASLTATINAGGLQAGSNEVELKFSQPSGVNIVGSYKVKLMLSDNNQTLQTQKETLSQETTASKETKPTEAVTNN